MKHRDSKYGGNGNGVRESYVKLACGDKPAAVAVAHAIRGLNGVPGVSDVTVSVVREGRDNTGVLVRGDVDSNRVATVVDRVVKTWRNPSYTIC